MPCRRTRNVGNGLRCSNCHQGAGGSGIKHPDGTQANPALWGRDAFNDGAGIARTYVAAAFVKKDMPLGQGNALTDQEAVDVAEFFTHPPRPIYPHKAKDRPKGDQPEDARN